MGPMGGPNMGMPPNMGCNMGMGRSPMGPGWYSLIIKDM